MLTMGQVLISGGVNFVTHTFTELASAELYPPERPGSAGSAGGPNT
jgi:hypothetical protein